MGLVLATHLTPAECRQLTIDQVEAIGWHLTPPDKRVR